MRQGDAKVGSKIGDNKHWDQDQDIKTQEN